MTKSSCKTGVEVISLISDSEDTENSQEYVHTKKKEKKSTKIIEKEQTPRKKRKRNAFHGNCFTKNKMLFLPHVCCFELWLKMLS